MKLGVFWRKLGNSIVYYPRLAKATGGVTAAVFFWQLFQQRSQLSDPNQWVKITFDEIEDETGLSRTEQELARRQLVEQSLLKERWLSDTVEFWPDIDALEERLENFWKEVNSVPSSKTSSKLTSQQKISDERGLRNSTTDLYSEIKTDTIVESIVPAKLEKNNPIDRESVSASRDCCTLPTEESYAKVGSSPTHIPNRPKISLTPPQPSPNHREGANFPRSVACRRLTAGHALSVNQGGTLGDNSDFCKRSNVLVEGSCTSTPMVKTDKFFPVQRQPISVKVTPNYQFTGPWNSIEQFEAFQRTLLEYFKNKGIDNPAGWVFKIVDGMTKGLVSPFWDEFVSGIPFGESQKVKRDWDIEPGVPYPAFEEERIQYYIHKGEPLEVAVSKARSDLRDPVLGKDLWDGFLRKCDRIADEAIRAKNLGVVTPYLPPSFTDKPQITKQSVINKLAAVAPQFSQTLTSSSKSLNGNRLEQQEIDDKARLPICDVPTLSSLQEAYRTPMGRTLVERQIAEHPEWGYGIVNGQVIDLIPF